MASPIPAMKNSNPIKSALIYALGIIIIFSTLGILLALTSSSSQNVQLFLDANGCAREFIPVVLSGKDIKIAKPDPEIFLTARASLGLPLESCYVIEDSNIGIQGSQADGMNVMGIVGQQSP